jgi:hypothetical protein
MIACWVLVVASKVAAGASRAEKGAILEELCPTTGLASQTGGADRLPLRSRLSNASPTRPIQEPKWSCNRTGVGEDLSSEGIGAS